MSQLNFGHMTARSALEPDPDEIEITIEPMTYAEVERHPAMQERRTIKVTGVPLHVIAFYDAMGKATGGSRDQAIVHALTRVIRDAS